MVTRGRAARVTWAIAVLVLATVALAPAPAQAAAGAVEDPPDVVGLPVGDATKILTDWNKAVLFAYVPAADIDLGVDPSLVLVARAEWKAAVNLAASQRPVVTLYLGRRVPELTGLPLARAREVMTELALGVNPSPTAAGPDWTVALQVPPAGTIVEFDRRVLAVTVRLDAPPVVTTPPGLPTPPPEPPRFSTVDLVLVGGSGAGLALLLLLGGLALRRARVRRSAPPVAERVEVVAHPGELAVPHLVESGPSVSVRLIGRPGTGTVTVEEER